MTLGRWVKTDANRTRQNPAMRCRPCLDTSASLDDDQVVPSPKHCKRQAFKDIALRLPSTRQRLQDDFVHESSTSLHPGRRPFGRRRHGPANGGHRVVEPAGPIHAPAIPGRAFDAVYPADVLNAASYSSAVGTAGTTTSVHGPFVELGFVTLGLGELGQADIPGFGQQRTVIDDLHIVHRRRGTLGLTSRRRAPFAIGIKVHLSEPDVDEIFSSHVSSDKASAALAKSAMTTSFSRWLPAA